MLLPGFFDKFEETVGDGCFSLGNYKAAPGKIM